MDQDQQERNTQPNNKNQKLIAGFVVVLAVVIVAVGVAFFTKKDPKINATASNTPASTSSDTGETAAPPAQSSSTSSSATYKDGDYSATGDYTSPGGNESITVHVTLKDGTVTDSSIDQVSSSRDGEEYQAEFKDGYKSQVVGKALNSISLSKVSGSSLTSKGFNEALQAIKSQAAS